jgi:hypothetical protein
VKLTLKNQSALTNFRAIQYNTFDMAESATPSSMPASFLGVNHLKIPVFNLQKSLDFYTNILPFKHEVKYNHYTPEHQLFAVMIVHEPTSLIVELRYAPEHAKDNVDGIQSPGAVKREMIWMNGLLGWTPKA